MSKDAHRAMCAYTITVLPYCAVPPAVSTERPDEAFIPLMVNVFC
ncbi:MULTISPECIES: hypothetical protein [unclassified Sulfitobacter]